MVNKVDEMAPWEALGTLTGIARAAGVEEHAADAVRVLTSALTELVVLRSRP